MKLRGKNNRTRIAIIGVLPPPFGGVTVHMDRLISLLEKHGTAYRFYELNGKSIPERSVTPISRSPFRFFEILLTVPEPVVHLHTDNTLALMLTAVVLSLRKTKTVFSLHSGSATTSYKVMSVFKKALFRLCLQRVSHFIPVNEETADWLRRLGVESSKISVIPAYLPPSEEEMARENLTDEMLTFIDNRTPILGSQGWFGDFCDGKDIYGFDLLLEMLHSLCAVHPDIGLYTVVSGTYDDAFRESIFRLREEMGLQDNWLIIEEAFPAVSLYRESDLFVRPTTTDGDSVSIRECLALGVPVIASDAVKRPPECILFETGDSASLSEVASGVIKDLAGPSEHCSESDAQSSGEQILVIYENLLCS